MITAKPETETASQKLHRLVRALNETPEAQREDGLFRVAVIWMRKGMLREEVEKQIVEASRLCRPAFPEYLARAVVQRAYDLKKSKDLSDKLPEQDSASAPMASGSDGGWIRVHRKIREHWLWPKDGKYSQLEAWEDLLMSANYKPSKAKIGFTIVHVARGQYLTSQVKLAEKWRWHRHTVARFLALLKGDGMIDTETNSRADTAYTLVSVCNYERYQGTSKQEIDTEANNRIDTDVLKRAKNFDTETNSRADTDESKETLELTRGYELNGSAHSTLEQKSESTSKGHARATSNKEKKKKESADPRVKEFIEWWGREYEKRFGAPYDFTYGKEGTLTKALLSQREMSQLKSLAIRFFESNDSWVRNNGGFTIGVFKSQINKLISTAKSRQRSEMKDFG